MRSATQEAASVRKCFNDYKRAILDRNGDAAVTLVDGKTLQYYGRIRNLALDGAPNTIRNLSTGDKMMVLTVRHRIPVEVVEGMTAESLFVYAVDEGWIGEKSVVNSEVGNISVSGKTATGAHISAGKKTGLKYLFCKEQGKWKLDLTAAMPVADQAFKQVIRQSGQSEDDFLLSVLESLSGRKVAENVWEPMRRTGAKDPM